MECIDYFRNLSHDELHRVMTICEQLHHAEPGQPFLRHCHATLNNAFSNVHFSAEVYQLDPLALKEQVMPTIDHNEYNDVWLPVFNEHILDHPFAKRLVTLPESEIGATHREAGLKTFRQSTLYNEYYDRVQAQNQIWAGIRHGSELLNCVYSRETEYTENELAMLCLIQPHLESAWKNWQRTRALQQELGVLKESIFQSEEEEAAAAQLRRAIDSLTQRQRTIVECVATGMDNQQISDALKISMPTVKKHLQMIFKQLDIQHRTQLAAKWHQAHSVQLY